MWTKLGLALLGLNDLSRFRNTGENKMGKTIYYRTKDGRVDYGFSIEKQPDSSLKAFITSMPSYGLRSNDIKITHRLIDTNGRYYVCWNRKLYDEDDLKSVIALWSDTTQEYIRTGETISDQMRRRR
ncbi:MAG: hypothetical protein ACR2N3_02610 [Pyrinomonadaceae bacterium]